MNWDWQTLAALAVVAVCLGYLLRQLVHYARGGTASQCGSCPSKNQSQRGRALPLVELKRRD